MKTGKFKTIVAALLLLSLPLFVPAEDNADAAAEAAFSVFGQRSAASDFIAFGVVPEKTPAPAVSTRSEAELDSFINATMMTYHIPGVAVSIIKDGEIFFSKGYGWANVGREVPVTDTTSFMLASVSKTVTGLDTEGTVCK